MAKVIIRGVEISETDFLLHLEFDFSLTSGGSMETYDMSVSKPNYLHWKETASSGANGILDYIEVMVRPHYDRLKAQRDLAVALNLVDKEVSW